MQDNTQLTTITQQTAEITKNVASIKTDIINAAAENNRSLHACLSAGEALFERVQNEGMSEPLDEEIASYIKKTKATAKAMKERRSAVTQIFDMVKKGFTTMENILDTKAEDSVVCMLQKSRDEYAAAKLEAIRKAEEERQRTLQIESEKAVLGDNTVHELIRITNEEVEKANCFISDKLRLMTLENAAQTKIDVSDYPTTFDIANLFAVRKPQYKEVLSAEEASVVMRIAYHSVADNLLESFKSTVLAAKQEFLDMFDSKVQELAEQRKLEEERIKAEEEARRASTEKERKEAEERARQAEAERQQREAELKAAEAAAEAERQQRSAEEQRQREEEERIRRANQQTQLLFDQTSSISTPLKAKVSYHIEVGAPEGFLSVIQVWWAHEGSMMTVDALAKKLSFMIKTCEKLKSKENITIVDNNIRYVEDVAAK